MNKSKKTVQHEIEEFLEQWAHNGFDSFLRDAIPIVTLFIHEKDGDLVSREVDDETEKVRLIRMVYLMSRMAEFNSGMLLDMKLRFKRLWERMDKVAEEQESE